ncbi:hypothetical protein C8R46DRAFT_1034747 [Mycena filopes]|nr:hypothetical protein C8R46DRAFT_1034747 [Mycena filopes]
MPGTAGSTTAVEHRHPLPADVADALEALRKIFDNVGKPRQKIAHIVNEARTVASALEPILKYYNINDPTIESVIEDLAHYAEGVATWSTFKRAIHHYKRLLKLFLDTIARILYPNIKNQQPGPEEDESMSEVSDIKKELDRPESRWFKELFLPDLEPEQLFEDALSVVDSLHDEGLLGRYDRRTLQDRGLSLDQKIRHFRSLIEARYHNQPFREAIRELLQMDSNINWMVRQSKPEFKISNLFPSDYEKDPVQLNNVTPANWLRSLFFPTIKQHQLEHLLEHTAYDIYRDMQRLANPRESATFRQPMTMNTFVQLFFELVEAHCGDLYFRQTLWKLLKKHPNTREVLKLRVETE